MPRTPDLPPRRLVAFVVVACVMVASLALTRSNHGLAALAPVGMAALGWAATRG